MPAEPDRGDTEESGVDPGSIGVTGMGPTAEAIASVLGDMAGPGHATSFDPHTGNVVGGGVVGDIPGPAASPNMRRGMTDEQASLTADNLANQFGGDRDKAGDFLAGLSGMGGGAYGAGTKAVYNKLKPPPEESNVQTSAPVPHEAEVVPAKVAKAPPAGEPAQWSGSPGGVVETVKFYVPEETSMPRTGRASGNDLEQAYYRTLAKIGEY